MQLDLAFVRVPDPENIILFGFEAANDSFSMASITTCCCSQSDYLPTQRQQRLTHMPI